MRGLRQRRQQSRSLPRRRLIRRSVPAADPPPDLLPESLRHVLQPPSPGRYPAATRNPSHRPVAYRRLDAALPALLRKRYSLLLPHRQPPKNPNPACHRSKRRKPMPAEPPGQRISVAKAGDIDASLDRRRTGYVLRHHAEYVSTRGAASGRCLEDNLLHTLVTCGVSDPLCRSGQQRLTIRCYHRDQIPPPTARPSCHRTSHECPSSIRRTVLPHRSFPPVSARGPGAFCDLTAREQIGLGASPSAARAYLTATGAYITIGSEYQPSINQVSTKS